MNKVKDDLEYLYLLYCNTEFLAVKAFNFKILE